MTITIHLASVDAGGLAGCHAIDLSDLKVFSSYRTVGNRVTARAGDGQRDVYYTYLAGSVQLTTLANTWVAFGRLVFHLVATDTSGTHRFFHEAVSDVVADKAAVWTPTEQTLLDCIAAQYAEATGRVRMLDVNRLLAGVTGDSAADPEPLALYEAPVVPVVSTYGATSTPADIGYFAAPASAARPASPEMEEVD